MGSGASTAAVDAASLPSLELGLDAPQMTVDDICAWIEAQSVEGKATIASELCSRIRNSGESMLLLLLCIRSVSILQSLTVLVSFV